MKHRPQSAIVKLKSEPSDPRSSFSHLMVSPKSIRPPQTPQQFHFDQETLYMSNLHQKQETNEIKFQNLKLRTLVQQLQARISQIERVDRHQFQVDPLGMSTNNGEGSIVPMLKAKIKQQAQIIEELTADLRTQCKSVKLTQILELQKLIKNQQDEIIKLRQFQQIALKITDQDLFNDPDIAERVENYIKTIDAQQTHINQLLKQNKKLNSEHQELLDKTNKLQEECKQISLERTQLKKKLDEQLITETEQYQQKKREFLENKLQSVLKQVDALKGELSLYENKYKQSTKLLQDQDREFKQTIMKAQKNKQNLEEIIQKKEQLIQDLQDRVAIQDLLKQKSANEEQPVVKFVQPPKTYRDQNFQFPEPSIPQHKPTDLINTIPIDQERLQQLLEDLKYKVISLCLTRQRLLHIFQYIEFMQLKDSVHYFMGSPFNYLEKDALILSRYFFSEDKGTGYKIQWEDTQSISDLIQMIIPKKEDTQFNFKTIVNRNHLIKQLNQQINNVQLNDAKYNVDDYIIYIKRNTNMNDQQITFLRLINQIYLGDVTNIDQGFLRIYLKEECEMQSQLYNLQKIDFVIYRYIPKLQIKQDDKEFEDFNITQKTSEQKIDESSPVFSQFRVSDSYLKTSESRKPTSARDTLTYSQSQIESVPLLKRPSDQLNRISNNSIKEEEESFEFGISDQLMIQPPQLLKNKEPIQETEEEYQEIYQEEL